MTKKINLTLGRIAAPEFCSALQKLRRLPLGPEAYALAKSVRTIESEQSVYQEAFAAIVKEFGQEKAPGQWEVSGEEAKKKAGALITALHGKKFEIYLDHKIKLPEAALTAEFTADDFLWLEPLIEFS